MQAFFSGNKPRLFAHRGASGETPENTLVAFRRAVELGIVYAELDVHASRDGVVVVSHDATLERTTDSHGHIQDILWRNCGKLMQDSIFLLMVGGHFRSVALM